MGGYSKKFLSVALSVALLIPAGAQGWTMKAYAAGEDILSGTVKMYGYGKAESTAEAKSGVPVSITLKNDEKATATSSDEGSFSYEVPSEKKIESGKYATEIKATEEYLSGTDTLTAGEEKTLFIEERYEPKKADFKLSNQDGVENGAISEAGTYTIEGVGGKKLSKTLDGTASSSISVSIDGNGNIETFYIYPDDTCSKPYDDATVPVDRDGPVITSVSTSPGDNQTYVKAHGIYGKTKADIIVTATITEDGAGIDEVYIIGKKDGIETRYEASKVSGEGKYEAVIGLPSEETILNAETMYLVAVDRFGNKTEALIAKNENASSVTLELIPPEASYTVSPEPNEHGWYSEPPTITVKAQDTLSGLAEIELFQDGKSLKKQTIDEKETGECSIDAKAQPSSASDNNSKFKIVAKDNAGNEVEKEFTLKIDTGAPKVSFEGAEDDGNYNSLPNLKVKTDEKTPDEEGNLITVLIEKIGSSETETLTFEKTAEAAIPGSAFKSDGEYLITASAVDAAGNASTEAVISFIYDTTKPSVSLAPTTQPNGNGWYASLPSLSASASDALSGLANFSIKEDGEDIWSKEYDERERTIQNAEGKAFINEPSSDGGYTFVASAEDKAGNKEERSMKLYIDLTAPKLSTSGVTSGTHYRSSPSITINEEEKYYKAKGAYIRYSLSRDGKSIANTRLDRVNTANIPTRLFSKDGNYKLTISAKDAAGHEAKALSYSFVVDRTKPAISLTGAENGRFYNSPKKITLKVVERFYKTNSVKVSATRKLGGTHNVGFPWKNTGKTSVSSKTFSETGTYTVTANATDKAGNKAAGKSLTFTVDTKAPVINITGVQDKKVYVYGEAVAPKVTVTDDYPGSHSVVYTKGGEIIQNPDFGPQKENDGTYTMVVTATDKAGNSSRKEISFVINRFGSYFVYPDATKDLMGKAMQTQGSDVSIMEHNVSKLEKSQRTIHRDGKKIEALAQTDEKLGDKENVYTHTFDKSNFEEEGKYELNIISKDEAGNEMESKEENGELVFYVDRTPPSVNVTGIDPKGNKGETATLTVSVSDTLTGIKNISATVDGEARDLTENEDKTYTLTLGSGLRQDIKISAEDSAGNTGSFSDRASVSTNALSLFLDRFIWPVLGVAGALLAGLLFFLFGKKKKKEEE